MTAPLWVHVDPFKPFVLMTDVFDFIIGVMFSQLGKNKLFHLFDFCYYKFSLMQINYDIHHK
jgi:hypothetical protein